MDNGSTIKKMLEDALRKKQAAKDQADFQVVADGIVEKVAGAILPKDVSDAVIDRLEKAIQPVLVQLLEKDRTSNQDIIAAIKEIQLSVPKTEFPEQKAPIVNVPAPVVNVPAPVVNLPEIKFPEQLPYPTEFGIRGLNPKNPLPVQLVDMAGKPYFPNDSSATGGKSDFFTIKDIQNSSGGSVIDYTTGYLNVRLPEGLTVAGSNNSTQLIDSSGNALGSAANPLNVSVASSATSTIAQIGNSDGDFSAANPLPVTFTPSGATQPVSQVSGAAWSVSVNDIFGSTATNLINPDNRLKVELPTGSSGLTDTELRAAHIDVDQLSGSSWSTVVNSGTIDVVTGITNSVAVVNLDRDGNPAAAWQVYPSVSGLNETNTGVLRTVQMTDSIASVNLASQNVTLNVRQVSGASDSVNILAGTITTVTTVTGITNSVAIVGEIASDVADTGNAPVKIGGIARTANPTAVAAGDRVSATFDDLGRQLIRPVQVRDLIFTAYVALTNGTETTLLAASAGSFHDLIMLTATNNSTAATQLDIRCTTGGNIVHTMYLPASSGPIGFAPAVPWPQDATGNNWTIDMPDQTGTTVYVSGLFSREI